MTAATLGLPWRTGARVVTIDDLSQRSDTALVVAVARRHEPALSELYRRHGGAVWALARRVTSDVHLAEDVCQTVFLRLWTEPDRYDADRGTLRTWLLAQAHGRAVDLVRSEMARRRRQERDAEVRPVRSAEVEAEVHAELLADDVRKAVDGLPEGERDAILLSYYGGHSYRETAALLGQPEGTVKSRIRSGLLRLRDAFQAAGVMP